MNNLLTFKDKLKLFFGLTVRLRPEIPDDIWTRKTLRKVQTHRLTIKTDTGLLFIDMNNRCNMPIITHRDSSSLEEISKFSWDVEWLSIEPWKIFLEIAKNSGFFEVNYAERKAKYPFHNLVKMECIENSEEECSIEEWIKDYSEILLFVNSDHSVDAWDVFNHKKVYLSSAVYYGNVNRSYWNRCVDFGAFVRQIHKKAKLSAKVYLERDDHYFGNKYSKAKWIHLHHEN